jgi:DNA-binding NarL/FixJ family response regulator
MSTKARLLLVHDDTLYRQCLATALAASGYTVAVAASVAEAGHVLHDEQPDVLLVARGLPDPGELTLSRWVAGAFPGVKVLLLGLPETCEAVRECAEAGSTGYVAKGASLEELLEHIDQVLRGETSCSPRAVRFLFGHLADMARRREDGRDNGVECLSEREREILALIAEDLSNKEIAVRLSLSTHTVKNHVHNVLEKLAAPTRHAAVRYARERGWLLPVPAESDSLPPGSPPGPTLKARGRGRFRVAPL